jgi:hypothetical protein
MPTPTPFESAQLILKLFELRREATLREARNWWLREFHPETIDDVRKVLQSDRNASYRMVVGYWDMACSLVAHGAIDRQMFLDANGEVIGTYSKLELLIDEVRAASPNPQFAKQIQALVESIPDVKPRLAAFRARLKPAPAKS